MCRAGLRGLSVTGRRRNQRIKALLIAITVVVVATAPMWTVRGFLYVVGAAAAGAGLFVAGMVLQLYVGFRKFESRVDQLARRVFGHRTAPPPRLRVVCAWCKNDISPGIEPISHGMCRPCARTQEREWARRPVPPSLRAGRV